MAIRYWVGADNAVWSVSSSWRTTISGTSGGLVADGDTVHFCNTAVANGNRNTYMNVSARSLPVIYGNGNMGATSINGGTSAAPTNQTLTMGVLGFDLATNNAANNLTIGSTALVYLPATITVNAGTRTVFLNSVISGANRAGLSISGAVSFQGSVNHTFNGVIDILGGTTIISAYLTGNYGNDSSLWVRNGAACNMTLNNVNGTGMPSTGNGFTWIISGTLTSNGVTQTLPFYTQLINGTMTGTGTASLGAYQVKSGESAAIDSTTGGSATGSITANVGVPANSLLTFYIKAGKTITVSGVVGTSGASAGSLVKASSGNDGGTLTLSGTNIYSGGSTINAGTVKADNLQALGTGPVTVSGSTARLQTSSALNGKLTIGGKLTMASSGILRIGG